MESSDATILAPRKRQVLLDVTIKILLFALLVSLRAAIVRAESPLNSRTLASLINQRLAAEGTSNLGIDDSEFLRRVYLDLIGRIPTVGEARSFLAIDTADRRTALVRQLLRSPAAARHRATSWRRQWLPQADQPQWMLAEQAEGWLARQIRNQERFDSIVKTLLTTSLHSDSAEESKVFLIASEFKPENLAANATRAFLGVNLDCAQCHNHPHARWTREQFWETAAFFARPTQAAGASAQLSLMIPETKITVSPKLLTGDQPAWPASPSAETGRTLFANWVVSKENPFFAQNAVNRLWAQYFGIGLVEPLDDLSGQNPASHPELLAELASAFIESNYDVDFITEGMLLSEAYAASSKFEATGTLAPKPFERFAVRGMTGEQLYDSLRVAAGLPPERDDLDGQGSFRKRLQFAERFRIERASLAQRSILQSLSLMNGELIKEVTSVDASPTLRAIAKAPFLDSSGKVESLFFAALSRKPTMDEMQMMAPQVEQRGDAALADLFWALLNSSEFCTIH